MVEQRMRKRRVSAAVGRTVAGLSRTVPISNIRAVQRKLSADLCGAGYGFGCGFYWRCLGVSTMTHLACYYWQSSRSQP